MNDLIDRQKAIDALIDALAWTWSGTWSEKSAIDVIKKLPSVDAVEVVRCKDCKHNSLKRMSGNTYCDLGMGLFQLYDFCSLGERRTDG